MYIFNSVIHIPLANNLPSAHGLRSSCFTTIKCMCISVKLIGSKGETEELLIKGAKTAMGMAEDGRGGRVLAVRVITRGQGSGCIVPDMVAPSFNVPPGNAKYIRRLINFSI